MVTTNERRSSSSSSTIHSVAVDINNDNNLEKQQPQKDTTTSQAPATRAAKQTWRTVILLTGILLCNFTVSMNSTVIAPAMNTIATELGSQELQTWIATSFMVAMNSSQPLSGKFSDIFGRKPVYLSGLFFFLAGSLINALSPSIRVLIIGRTVQGFGAGGMMSMVYIIITDITPIQWRPRLQSLLAVVYGLASVVGTLVGGAFVDYLTWRWDFWLNLIIAGVAAVILIFFLHETANIQQEPILTKFKRIDFLGVVFAIGTITNLLLALNYGPQYGWNDPHSFGPFIAAGVSLICLVIVEGWIAKEPILPRQVIFNRGVLPVYLYMICLGVSFIGTLYFGPILFQAVFGADSTGSGIRLIPFMALLIVGSVGSGFLLRKFPYIKFFICLGAASNMIGYGLFYTVNESSNWGRQAAVLVFCGFAFGLSQQNCILSTQYSAPRKYLAVATGLNQFCMFLAFSISVAVYQTLFSTFLKAQYTVVDPQILAIAKEYGAINNYLYIRDMPAEAQPPIIHAYMEALHNVFIIPIVAAGLSLICALCTRNVRFGQPLGGTQQPPPQQKNEKVVEDA